MEDAPGSLPDLLNKASRYETFYPSLAIFAVMFVNIVLILDFLQYDASLSVYLVNSFSYFVVASLTGVLFMYTIFATGRLLSQFSVVVATLLFVPLIIIIFSYFYYDVSGICGAREEGIIECTQGSSEASLYFSVVTFTTLGFGDFTPSGTSRALVGFEAIVGLVVILILAVQLGSLSSDYTYKRYRDVD